MCKIKATYLLTYLGTAGKTTGPGVKLSACSLSTSRPAFSIARG